MGIPKKDLTNQHFGKLTVIKYIENSKWLCLCECGKKTIVKTSALNNGTTKSCGCLRGENTKNNIRNKGPKENLIGQTFTYLSPYEYIKGGKWKCHCKCGNSIIVDTRNLKSGHTKSCGCFLKEKNSQNYTKDMLNYESEFIKVLEYAGVDNQQTVLWKCYCKKCGNIFITRGSTIRNGSTKSCGCIHSFNEIKITKILLNNNIEFSTQYTFPDLIGINGGHLRFDFAIFKCGKLSHLIEYNGKQHYEPGNGSWANNFETQIKNDQLKKEYCKNHNIELRIIKYNEDYDLNDLI